MNVIIVRSSLLLHNVIIDTYKDQNIISNVTRPVRKIVFEKDGYKTTIRVPERLTDNSLRGIHVDVMYMTPADYVKYSHLTSAFYINNPLFRIILLLD